MQPHLPDAELQQLLTENTAASDYSDLATSLSMETNQEKS